MQKYSRRYLAIQYVKHLREEWEKLNVPPQTEEEWMLDMQDELALAGFTDGHEYLWEDLLKKDLMLHIIY